MIYKNVISSQGALYQPWKDQMTGLLGKYLNVLCHPVPRLFHLIKHRLKTIAWLLLLRPRERIHGTCSGFIVSMSLTLSS